MKKIYRFRKIVKGFRKIGRVLGKMEDMQDIKKAPFSLTRACN